MIAQATAQPTANPAYVGLQYHLGTDREGREFSFGACIGMPPVTSGAGHSGHLSKRYHFDRSQSRAAVAKDRLVGQSRDDGR
jgi:hypothetical protein